MTDVDQSKDTGARDDILEGASFSPTTGEWIKGSVFFIGLAVCATACRLLMPPSAQSVLEGTMKHLGMWGPIFYLLLHLLRPFAALPVGPMVILSGAAFGPVPGAIWSWIGTLTGCAVAYGLARWLAQGLVQSLTQKRFTRFHLRLRSASFWQLAMIRLFPFLPVDVANFAAGSAGVPFLTFLAATAVGTVPGCILFPAIGHWATGMG